jgi:hypothetical protein
MATMGEKSWSIKNIWIKFKGIDRVIFVEKILFVKDSITKEKLKIMNYWWMDLIQVATSIVCYWF